MQQVPEKQETGGERGGRAGRRLPLCAMLLLWGVLLVGAAYGDALALPFFFDDLIHLPYVESRSVGEMMRSGEGLAYYRPLPFVIWRLLYLALGTHSAPLHHGLNLLLHLASGALVGWLAAVLWQRQPRPTLRALLSATLFWLYPFSYQAVPWAGAMVHLLATALLLLAVAAYLRWRQGRGRHWLLLSLAATALAPFAHENGVLVGPAIFLVALAWGESARVAARQALLWAIPAALWLPLWWLAPKGVAESTALNGLESIAQNTAYLLQGMGYPAAFAGGWLVRRGMNDMAAVLLLALPALALAAWVQWRAAGPRRLALFPWLWSALAWAPALLVLTFGYVVGSPRLLVLASAGVAWLWADVVVGLLPKLLPKLLPRLLPRLLPASSGREIAGREALRLVLVAAGLVLVLLASVAFIRTRMGSHRLLDSAVEGAVAATRWANGQGREALVLNFPTWTAPAQQTFALGHEGVTLWPAYMPQAAIVSAQTGEPAAFRMAEYADIREPLPYYLGTDGGGPVWAELAAARAAVFVAEPVRERIEVQPAGMFDPTLETAEPVARFGERISLLAAEASTLGQTTLVTLTWRLEASPEGPLTVFVHLLNEGRLEAQDDGHPLAGTYPFVLWPAWQSMVDVRLLRATGETALVGLYDPLTGERMAAVDARGKLSGDGAVRVEVR